MWSKLELRHDKTNKVTVRLARTQISLGIRPVWSESSLSAWRKLRSLPIKRTAKTLIRLGRCPGWSESSLGAQSLCSFCHVTAHSLNNNPESAQWFQRTTNIIGTSKTFQNSLVTRATWFCKHEWESWRKLEPLATHRAHSEDSDQTGRMPRLIWVFAGHTLPLLVLSCHGSLVESCVKPRPYP